MVGMDGKLNELAEEIHGIFVATGKHERYREPGTFIADLHAAVTEAWINDSMETTSRHDGKPEGFASEMAAVIIGALDFCEAMGVEDIEKRIEERVEWNRTRPYRHGGEQA